MKGSV